jgi:S1-C subfamily serine protease
MSHGKANWIIRSPGRRSVHACAAAPAWLVFLGFLLVLLALLPATAACGNGWTGSIGAILAKNNQTGRVFVREVPADMGAARAGLQIDDELLAVDGRPVATMTSDDLHMVLSGKVGSRVRLKVLHDGVTREVWVERGPLVAPPAPPD